MKPLLVPNLVLLAATAVLAQTPAVPEPGVVLYGRILAADGTTTVPATAVNLTIRREGGSAKTVAGRVTEVGGEWYFVAHVPFETVIAGLVGDSDFDFDSSQTADDTFGLDPNPALSTATYGGGTDGVVAVASASSVTSFGFGRGSARGDVVRMDLLTGFSVAGLPEYLAWAVSYFGGAGGDGARGADPDADGMTNEQEWLFRTDPTNTDPDKRLHKLVVHIEAVAGASGRVRVAFAPKWNDGRAYAIQKTTDLGMADAWAVPVPPIPLVDGQAIGATGAVEAAGTDPAATGLGAQYRVEVEIGD